MRRDASYQRTTCRFCGSSHLTLVIPMKATPPGDHYVAAGDKDREQQVYPLDVFLCDDCGLLQLLFVVDPAIIYDRYLYTTSVSLGLQDHFRQSYHNATRFAEPGQTSLVVDLGSNDGTLLRFFKQAGYRVLGVDPAGPIAAKATASGIPTIATFFNLEAAQRIHAEHGPASIVTANNVVANIDDLGEFFTAVRHLMAPNGVFIMEAGYAVDVVQNMLLDVIHHEHISYFAFGPLEAFFRRNGMQLIHAERIASKGGSIRVVVQLAGGGRPVNQSVGQLMAMERTIGAHQPPFYQAFAARVARIEEGLISLLHGIKAEGKTVAGYGASIGTTTLSYRFGVKPFVDVLVDDNPQRYGLLSPGLHLPVKPSTWVEESSPDYLLVFAWRYLDAIRKKHQQFTGHYILPLPELTVA